MSVCRLSAACLPKHQHRQEAPAQAAPAQAEAPTQAGGSTRQKVNEGTSILFIKNYPFNPVMAIPSVKIFRKKKNRISIGTVRRVAPAV